MSIKEQRLKRRNAKLLKLLIETTTELEGYIVDGEHTGENTNAPTKRLVKRCRKAINEEQA